MLLIRCAYCRTKLFKYQKIGPGEVLRCHKKRIFKVFKAEAANGKLYCGSCGKVIALEKDSFYKMIKKAFTSKGEKISSS